MRALITGCGGQDGHYLAEYLQNLGYQVYGGYRRSTKGELPDVEPVLVEMSEFETLRRAINSVKPDEIYNLAAQSHVGESFNCPEYTHDVNSAGVLRLLELVRETPIKVYQASSSEMFGGGVGLNEQSPFGPRSPYAVSKLAAHNFCGVYRNAYSVRVSCGILFNHESPLRGKNFVTRKIVYHMVNGLPLKLGNLESRRDWGHAKDYVRAMHLMLQNDPDDFVVATGECHSVREFISECEKHVAPVPIESVEFEKRPWDVDVLEGDPSKIREKLGWIPMYGFENLVEDMIRNESD